MTSQISRVLAVIEEGPATSTEVAIETELPLKHCCVHLRALWQRGILVRKDAPALASHTGRKPHLYSLARGYPGLEEQTNG